jgi:hypothetical protein
MYIYILNPPSRFLGREVGHLRSLLSTPADPKPCSERQVKSSYNYGLIFLNIPGIVVPVDDFVEVGCRRQCSYGSREDQRCDLLPSSFFFAFFLFFALLKSGGIVVSQVGLLLLVSPLNFRLRLSEVRGRASCIEEVVGVSSYNEFPNASITWMRCYVSPLLN